MDDLQKISILSESKLSTKTVKNLQSFLESKNKAISTLALTVLYIDAPQKYKKAFFQTFYVTKFDKYSDTIYNFVSDEILEEMLFEVDETEQTNPFFKKVLLLIYFLMSKKDNLWIEKWDGNISVARILREKYWGTFPGLVSAGLDELGVLVDEKELKN